MSSLTGLDTSLTMRGHFASCSRIDSYTLFHCQLIPLRCMSRPTYCWLLRRPDGQVCSTERGLSTIDGSDKRAMNEHSREDFLKCVLWERDIRQNGWVMSYPALGMSSSEPAHGSADITNNVSTQRLTLVLILHHYHGGTDYAAHASQSVSWTSVVIQF